MTEVQEGTEELLIQVRELPGQRSLCSRYQGPRSGFASAVEKLTGHAASSGVGPCGPTLADYAHLASDELDATLDVTILVPVRGRPESEEYPVIEGRPMRAACMHYTGPSDQAFRRAHEALFSWMDANGFPRMGTRHFHAYLAGQEGNAEWTVELRVPVLGGDAPRPAF